jgi:hypothetical protein
MASSIEVFSLFEIIKHLFGSSLIKFECKNLNEVGGVSRQREKSQYFDKNTYWETDVEGLNQGVQN